MTNFEKGVKSFAIALAVILCIAILGAIASAVGGVVNGIRHGAAAVSEAAETASEAISDSAQQVHSDLYNEVAEQLPESSEYYFSTDDVEDLSIQNGIGDMTIRETDDSRIHVTLGSTTECCSVGLSGDTLKIENSGVDVEIFGIRIGEKVENGEGGMVVEVPKGFAFEDVSVENGVGNMDISGIYAEDITISNGTGDLEIDRIDAEKIKVESGIGEIGINFDCPMSTYDMRIDPGVGEIRINGVKQSEISHTNRDAEKSIRLSSSIGAIYVNFSD